MELFQTIICHGDIREPSLLSLATNLWGLAQKHGELDTKVMVCTIMRCKFFTQRGGGALIASVCEYLRCINVLYIDTEGILYTFLEKY